ncbi:hypothetical protein D9M72_364880 [compost metagenome]
MASRNSPETPLPIRPSTRFPVVPSSMNWPTMAAPPTTRTPARITTELWPRLNANPTLTGSLCWATNFRVELSIAARWSQS